MYIKPLNIYCEVCEGNIKKSNMKTRKHGSVCGDIVAEDVEKKQCCKCRGHKVLEIFSGKTTCNGCLAHRKNGQGIIQKKLGRSGVAEIRGGT